MGLTRRQRQALEFIKDYWNQYDRAPTYREIGQGICTGHWYHSTVHRLLSALITRGHLRRGAARFRNIEIVPDSALASTLLPNDASAKTAPSDTDLSAGCDVGGRFSRSI